jgi:hypothetical protein
MAKSSGLEFCFAITVACAMSACSGNDATSPGGGQGAATGSGGAATGAGGTGGSPNAGGSGSATQGGSGGSSGMSQSGGASSSTTGVDLAGTWIADVQSPGTVTVPLAGTVNANLRFVIRLFVAPTTGTLNMTFDICKLTVVTTPDPKTLSVTFTPAVLATLTTSASEPAPVVNVGDAVPIPALTILSGVDASGNRVDADADSHPGVTLPGNVFGTIALNAYAGLTVNASFSPKLTAPDAISGTASFAATGKVFGSDNPLVTGGDMSVTPTPSDVPFTAKLLPGDVPCADVLTALQITP